MAEAYKVKLNSCTFAPPGSDPPSKIDMPVSKVGSPPTPVFTIRAQQGSSASWERETSNAADRYADIFFNKNQFKTLVANIKDGKTTYVTYDAPAIANDDRISNQKVTSNYP